MATPEKRKKHEENGRAEKPVGVNLAAVNLQWTPERSHRAIDGTKKVRSAEDGPLIGGDWVLNEQGGATTLSFCFENPEGTECYGLTVGHLAKSVGDSIFCFAESEPNPVPALEGEIDREEYFMFEIGQVTSISTETDSLVFKMDLDKDKYIPMQIAVSSQTHITLDENLLSLAMDVPTCGSGFVGFGAQRRGSWCQVLVPSSSSAGQFIFTGDIGLSFAADPRSPATDAGDCGTIFCSAVNGAPAYVHHVLATLSDDRKISYGVPLLTILSAHEETRHLVPVSHDAQKSAPRDKKVKAESSSHHESDAHEISGVKQFKTRVVDRPNYKYDAVSNAKAGASLLSSDYDGVAQTEDQTLAVFNVQVRKKPASSGKKAHATV